jgi:hypothetical protein
MIAKFDIAKKGLIQLTFRPTWSFIPCTRIFVQNFFRLSISDNIKTHKIALAVSELLENAVKFTCNEQSIIKLNVSPQKEVIRVEVENESRKEHIYELKRIYNKLQKGNKLENYLESMKLAAHYENGKSQLGLARLHYELEEKISLNIIGKVVRIAVNIK